MWTYNTDYLAHHGILGQKWGVRRYQNEDGSLTPAGKSRYTNADKVSEKKSAMDSLKNEYKSSTGLDRKISKLKYKEAKKDYRKELNKENEKFSDKKDRTKMNLLVSDGAARVDRMLNKNKNMTLEEAKKKVITQAVVATTLTTAATLGYFAVSKKIENARTEKRFKEAIDNSVKWRALWEGAPDLPNFGPSYIGKK